MKLLLLFSICSLFYGIWGIDIQLEVVNGSQKDKPAKLDSLEILQLKNGMTPIRSMEIKSSKVIIKDVKEYAENFPLMLKGIYQGIAYNQIIPPAKEEGIEKMKKITLTVYNKTHQFKPKIKYSTLYSIKYLPKKLNILVLHNFSNDSKLTFTERGSTKGIFQHIPSIANEINASVSIGNNTQWLKVAPIQSPRKNIYILPYPLKPGNRLYQLNYSVPYKGDNMKLTLVKIYDQNEPIQVILENDDLRLSVADKPYLESRQMPNDNNTWKIFELPLFPQSLDITLSGGTPLSEDQEALSSGKVSVRAPLSYTEKATFALIAFLMIILFFYMIIKLNPSWLINYRIKQKAQIKYRLDILNATDMNFKNKEALRKKFEKRLKNIESHLDL